MSNYTKSTNFATKDNLSPGDPLKIVRGTEIDTEFNNIATAIATKTDNASAAITGGSITGITDLAIADGGTGASTATAAINNLLPSQTSNANKYLQTDGTNVSWDAVSLSTADITGTLPVANGGTGVTSSTGTGSVVLSNSPTLVTPALGTPSSGTLTNATGLPISTGVSGLGTGVATFLATPSSANLRSALTDETGTGSAVFATSPALVTPDLGTPSAATLTNATGLPISTGVSGLGTGVATALAVNVGSAGAPVVNGGALGTPSSGTVTNLTGTASININGTVGATTPTTGAFTTVAASSDVTLSGGTANGVTYLNGSKVLTSGSALVFDGTRLSIGSGNSTAAGLTAGYFGASGYGAIWSTSVTPLTTNFAFLTNGSSTVLNGSSNVTFQVNNADSMALTSTGLGIGTSSPTSKLHVVSSANTRAIAQNTNAAGSAGGVYWDMQSAAATAGSAWYRAVRGLDESGNLRWSIGQYGAPEDTIGFYTGTSGTERMRLDSAGNLGLGVTPSAWLSTRKVLQNGNAAFVSAPSVPAFFQLSANTYTDSGGTDKYISTAASTNYAQVNGQHQWFNAASGTAGNTISFTQAMTLDASGNLGVGTTSPDARLDVTSAGTASTYTVSAVIQDGTYPASGNPTLEFNGFIGGNGYRSGVGSIGGQQLAFYTPSTYGVAPTERARIDSSGNLLVGTTAALDGPARIAVSVTSSQPDAMHFKPTSNVTYYPAVYINSSGTTIGFIESTNTATSYSTSSDYRLKNTITPMTGALAKVALLKPCTYKWNVDGSDGEGFIAHELAEVCPHAVTGEKDAMDENGNPKYQGIDTSFLVATLTAALQELNAKFDAYVASHP